MKKYLTILCILALLFSTGCARSKKISSPEENKAEKIESSVVDFTDVPLYDTLASSTHEIYSSLDDYTENFNLEDYIIFKGIKNKASFVILYKHRA